uniref:Uncharacterized protein n=1 Tax=Anopheles coluzzii TaxID=1518534 RepID=A0A8W7PQT6_ANOCL
MHRYLDIVRRARLLVLPFRAVRGGAAGFGIGFGVLLVGGKEGATESPLLLVVTAVPPLPLLLERHLRQRLLLLLLLLLLLHWSTKPHFLQLHLLPQSTLLPVCLLLQLLFPGLQFNVVNVNDNVQFSE